MGKENSDVSAGDIAPLKEEAQRILQEVAAVKTAATEALTGIEAVRREADSHASYANQAKANAEEHANSTSTFKGEAVANAASIAQSKQNVDALLPAITSAKTIADNELKTISERRAQVDNAEAEATKAATAATELLAQVTATKTSVDGLLTTTQSSQTSATTAATAITAIQTNLEALQIKAKAASDASGESQKASQKGSQEITTFLAAAKTNADGVAKICTDLKDTDALTKTHEARIAVLTEEIAGLKTKIEGLLPGATSAGLASAFNAQQKRFRTAQRWWFGTFLVSIVLLLLVSLPSFLHAAFGWAPHQGDPNSAPPATPANNWSDIFMGLTLRLPIIGPLLWLAVYAGRNYMLSIRLEEDYAYKEALSTAFEGYKNQMRDVKSSDSRSLETLCHNILQALALRPGRIYEGRHSDNDITPATEITGALFSKPVAVTPTPAPSALPATPASPAAT